MPPKKSLLSVVKNYSFMADKNSLIQGNSRSFLFFIFYILTIPYTCLFLINLKLWEDCFLYNLLLLLTYPAIYIIPVFLFMIIIGFIMRFTPLRHFRFSLFFATFFLSVLHLILLINLKIYAMFGFYFNSFIWNIVSTPGGIESLGATRKAYYSLLILLSFIFIINFLLLKFLKSRLTAFIKPPFFKLFFAVLLLLSFAERFYFALAHQKQTASVLQSASYIPFHQPATFKRLANKLNLDISREKDVELSDSSLNYPLKKITFEDNVKTPNIVWIVAESLRADMLNTETMPHLCKFAEKALNFKNHHSGGNGTRMGLFSMFYSLSGPYWFSFLRESIPPLIMQRLTELDYQFFIATSARFSYPEFDRTIFSQTAPENLHESKAPSGWEKDRDLVGQAIKFIKNRDPSKPFMTFHFMESPHAPYYFPDEALLKPDYLPYFNYTTTNIAKNIAGIFKRYINSCYNLNLEANRIISFLKDERLLENTVVIITGDHGEEFMEKGYWGHNSSFVDEQVKVPLIIYFPDEKPGEILYPTSHMDIAPTILKKLGIRNPLADFSQGINLLEPQEDGRNIFIANWSEICLKINNQKFVFPINNYLKKPYVLINDSVVTKESLNPELLQQVTAKIITNLTFFRKKEA